MFGKTQPFKNGKCNYCDKLIRAPINLDLHVGLKLLMFFWLDQEIHFLDQSPVVYNIKFKNNLK
jgi:hypothetical protein